jgi:predicted Zn finger-like uncharacterized protein
MKIVCDACQAKYSIADEKVQGKAFKIRCKKCNHIIVVRSGGERAVGAATEPKPAPAEAQGTWYVVVEGEQMGPLAEPDIAARLRRGEITGESLVWKEGLADWVKLSAVPELAQMSSSQATPGTQPTSAPAAEPAPVRRSSAAMRAHGSSREAAMAAAPGEDIFSRPAPAASASADLFASPAVAHSSAAAEAPASASSAFAFGAASAPAPEPAARAPGNGAGESHMTGQRNENSVLFSLANLEALAVPSSSTSARAPSTFVRWPQEPLESRAETMLSAARTPCQPSRRRSSHRWLRCFFLWLRAARPSGCTRFWGYSPLASSPLAWASTRWCRCLLRRPPRLRRSSCPRW